MSVPAIEPPPLDLSDEAALRAWFRSLPMPVCLLIAGEIEWIAWGHVAATRRFLEWFRGRMNYSEFAKGNSPFAVTGYGRRGTTRKRVSLATCVAHAERGSPISVADASARLLGPVLASTWPMANLLDWYAEFPPRAVEFARGVDVVEDRIVLCDLLHDLGWTPFNEDVADIFSGRE